MYEKVCERIILSLSRSIMMYKTCYTIFFKYVYVFYRWKSIYTKNDKLKTDVLISTSIIYF